MTYFSGVGPLILMLGVVAALAPTDLSPLTARQRAIHLLSRASFGPTPGQVDAVLSQGPDAYLETQLHAENLADEELTAMLQDFAALRMDAKTLWETYERPAAQDANAAGAPPKRREALDELMTARLLRGRYARAQLNEVMVDFWLNHFNVLFRSAHTALIPFERDVIRRHLWSSFSSMLRATARSPAMLSYLNNAQSVAPENARSKAPKKKPDSRGLNENYARELMELHTLGVDGGYTQHDVTELARALTGWSIDKAENGRGFLFKANLHDVGAKAVLGVQLPAGGGEEEGDAMLNVLAHHPSTARHLARKLCERLVSDSCSDAFVFTIERRFLANGGDLRDTVLGIFSHPDFYAPQHYRSKIKTPLEYVLSALRATQARTDGGRSLIGRLQEMGEPLYGCVPPTGYSDRADSWVSSGGLLTRLNFALALTANKLPGTWVEFKTLWPDPVPNTAGAALQILQARLLSGEPLTPATAGTIDRFVGDPNHPHTDPTALTEGPRLAALVLGSPEFQRQ